MTMRTYPKKIDNCELIWKVASCIVFLVVLRGMALTGILKGNRFDLMLKHIVIIGIAGLLIGCSSPPKETPRTETPAHSFGIYLVNGTPQQPWTPATLGSLADIALFREPVLSDADILNYDFTSHKFLVRREALSRLPEPPVWHQPFVIVADGQRIYLGAFITLLSSYSSPVPSIVVDVRKFTNELSITRSYPAPGFGDGTDPRGDERIRVALAGLHKL
jgi:hypothetical protein